MVESPKQEKKDLQVKLFGSLPDGNDIRNDNVINQSVILGAALQEILLANKNNITLLLALKSKLSTWTVILTLTTTALIIK